MGSNGSEAKKNKKNLASQNYSNESELWTVLSQLTSHEIPSWMLHHLPHKAVTEN